MDKVRAQANGYDHHHILEILRDLINIVAGDAELVDKSPMNKYAVRYHMEGVVVVDGTSQDDAREKFTSMVPQEIPYGGEYDESVEQLIGGLHMDGGHTWVKGVWEHNEQ